MKKLSLSLLLVVCGACTRASSDGVSRFSVTLPATQSKISSQGWGAAAPGSLDAINCYVVMIEGPESDMRDNSCQGADGASVANPGLVFGGYIPGETVQLSMASGDRTIYVLGIQAATEAACKNFRSNTNADDYLASAIVASTSGRFVDGTNQVQMTASLVGAKNVASCVGPDFPQLANTQEQDTGASEPLWIVDGDVKVSKVIDDKLYVGGEFSYVGPNNGYGTEVDAITGKRLSSFQSYAHLIDGYVFAVIPDGAGGWFVGGDFNMIGPTEQAKLAHLNADGSLHAIQPPEADGPVRALALYGSTLYVGGDFANIDGVSQSYLASIDLSANPYALTAWSPSLDGSVKSLDVDSSGKLYVGGVFTTIESSLRQAARFDNIGNFDSTWDPAPDAYINSIRVSKIDSTRVYLCGAFANAGGVANNRIAAVNVTDGNSVSFDTSAASIDSGDCNALAEDSTGRIYVAGDSMDISAVFWMGAGPYRFDASGALDTNFNPSFDDNNHKSLLLVNDVLYVGGTFSAVSGSARKSVAAIDINTKVIREWNPTANGGISALGYQSGRVFVGSGDFPSIGGVVRQNLASFFLNTGRATSFAPIVTGGVVSEIESDGSRLYVGGDFATVNGQSREHLAAFSVNSGQLVTNIGLPAEMNLDSNTEVTSLAVDSSYIYVGTTSPSVLGDDSYGYLFRIHKITGLLDTTWVPEPDDAVRDLLIDGSSLWAVGDFGFMNGVPASSGSILKFDKDSLALASGYTSAAPSDVVQKIYQNGNHIYLLGQFTSVDGNAMLGLARVDSSTGIVDSGWAPDFANGYVTGLAFDGSDIYVSGNFDEVGGQAHYGAAKIDASVASFVVDSSFDLGISVPQAFLGILRWNDRLILNGDIYMQYDTPTYTHLSPGLMTVDFAGDYFFEF